MDKNINMKKGISLIILTVTIAVMVMLVTTATISGVNSIDKAKKVKFATELSFMQEIVNSYTVNNNGAYPVSNVIVLDVSNVSAKAMGDFEGENIVANKINLYEINLGLLGKTQTIYGNKSGGTDDVYAMSKDTNKVYYIRGLKALGNTYYTLNDELKKDINYLSVSEGTLKDGIIFKSSNTEFTNEKITCNIKVPVNYTNINVVIKQSGTADVLLTSTTQGDYFEYNAKSQVSDTKGNYQIVVTYNKVNDTNTYTQTFNVTNYDGISPELSLSPVKKMDDSLNNQTYSYIDILSSKDDKSGIKVIKYENVKLEDSQKNTYFKTSGITVLDNSIKISQGASYVTVYIEDNAGNYNIYEVTL